MKFVSSLTVKINFSMPRVKQSEPVDTELVQQQPVRNRPQANLGSNYEVSFLWGNREVVVRLNQLLDKSFITAISK